MPKTERFKGCSCEGGTIRGNRDGMRFSASPDLMIIREAWDRGCDFEDLADGFGKGNGTQGGDWSGIRDSTPGAIAEMFTKALNHLFPK